jgi:hypothetical protein
MNARARGCIEIGCGLTGWIIADFLGAGKWEFISVLMAILWTATACEILHS